MKKRLYRSRSQRMISGVCGGLEDYLGIDVTIIRLVWVIFSIMSGFFPGLITYIIATVIIPEESGENEDWTENNVNPWRTKNDSDENPEPDDTKTEK